MSDESHEYRLIHHCQGERVVSQVFRSDYEALSHANMLRRLIATAGGGTMELQRRRVSGWQHVRAEEVEAKK